MGNRRFQLPSPEELKKIAHNQELKEIKDRDDREKFDAEHDAELFKEHIYSVILSQARRMKPCLIFRYPAHPSKYFEHFVTEEIKDKINAKGFDCKVDIKNNWRKVEVCYKENKDKTPEMK